ncbi:MAG: type II toxin-antitoxin system ParD family antitoxin [Proteobacteria bacterium]|nr:type II toxin-antitoxin system ParD family antitoxin [Pseudomonadota bacterium]
MGAVKKRTISLPTEHSAYIDAKVSSGSFGSASEVVRAGLRLLQEQDAVLERWLKEEVGPTYDAMKANSERGRPAREAFAELRARYVPRRKTRR